jgi:GNAT superfamily N-acetyltransferase
MSTELDVDVRRATPADADAITDVHVRTWRWTYRGQLPESFFADLRPERRAQRWRADLATDAIIAWVAERGERLVGFAGWGPTRDDDLDAGVVELHMINVLEEHIGRGVGQALMAAVEADWRARDYEQAVLWVLEANERALRFYARRGWERDGVTRMIEMGGAALPGLRMAKRLV